jgi:hypothetical protein
MRTRGSKYTDSVQHLRSAGALGHDRIAGIVVPVGYRTALPLTMNFRAVAPGTPGLARVLPRPPGPASERGKRGV